eukprot:1239163-Pyramimonas_sp.AAC.1
MGPGKARQWGLPDKFDNLTGGITTTFTGRGIAVLPAEQWNDTQDRQSDTCLASTEDGSQPCAIDATIHARRHSTESEG